MKARKLLWTIILGLGVCLASVSAWAQQTIILQYKYKVQFISQDGKFNVDGYLLVEIDEDGNFGATTPILVLLDKKAKTFLAGQWALTFNSDYPRYLVTASDANAVLYGPIKWFTLKGKFGGFTPFEFFLGNMSISLSGSENRYVSADNWYTTKKSTLKLDKARTKHYIEEGDDTMALAYAHLKRWLENKKGYTDVTP